jgi:nucleoside-diphosphate-sugar epimerase
MGHGRRILLTGATGFLGSYVSREMRRRELDFAVMARSAEKARWHREAGVAVCWGDVTSLDDCRKAVAGRDVVVHLAAAADVSDAAVNRRVNLGGLENVLRASEEARVDHLVFLSSTCAGRKHRDAYGETKLEGEGRVRAAKVPFTILRPTMIYGRGSKEWGTFVNAIRWSPVVPIIGSGRNVVRPVYVGDAVEAIVRAAVAPEALGQTYDLAGPTSISFDDLVRLVRRTKRLGPRLLVHLPVAPMLAAARLLGRVMTHVPLSVDQVMSFIQDTEVDIAPLERDLGVRPRPLDEGLPLVL